MDDDDLIPLRSDKFGGLDLPPSELAILVDAGLPADAAPFLSFDDGSDGMLNAARQSGAAPSNSDRYVQVGSTGSGDPVCVCPGGRVVYLNHDWDFREVFINSSPSSLATCLLAFRSMVKSAVHRDPDAFLDNAFTTAETRAFIEVVEAVDAPALEAGSFWADEAHIT